MTVVNGAVNYDGETAYAECNTGYVVIGPASLLCWPKLAAWTNGGTMTCTKTTPPAPIGNRSAESITALARMQICCAALGKRSFLDMPLNTQMTAVNNGMPVPLLQLANVTSNTTTTMTTKTIVNDNNINNNVNKTCQGDIVFLIDGSGSVGTQNFELIKQFLSNFVDGVEIGVDKSQIGVAQFASTYRLEFHLNTHSTKKSLKTAISKMSYMNGGTAISDVILYSLSIVPNLRALFFIGRT